MILNRFRRLLLVTTAATTLLVVFAGSALAAPPAMTLSSFEATATDGVVDGGTRTISVTNFGTETLSSHRIELGEAPCDCIVSGVAGGAGTLEDGTWIVGDLGPGESVEITFTYATDTAVTTAPALVDFETISMILLALMSAAAMALVARRTSQPGLAIQI